MDDFENSPVFHRDDKFWSTTLELPHISKLTDDEMGEHFRRYDGKWSPQTKEAVAHFRPEGLDLNDNWASVRQSWSCPCCERTKADIFRLSSRNVLLAKLEYHHDHMHDVVFRRARELCGGEANWRDLCRDSSANLIVDRIRDLVTRFPRTLVCSECNAADGLAKARLGLGASFTFTPSEIAQFIVRAPQKEHDLRIEKAREIWLDEEPKFSKRKQLLDQLIGDMLSGTIALDRSAGFKSFAAEAHFQQGALLADAFAEQERLTQRPSFLRSAHDSFIARSTSRAAPRSVMPAQPGAPARIPTDQEFEAYVDPVSSRSWLATENTWECPVCLRGKKAIMRWSKKSRKWSGSLRGHTVHHEEKDPREIENRVRLFPSFFNDRHISGAEPVLICSDCGDVKARLCHHDRSLAQPLLSLDDIQASIISSAPHQPHEVDLAIAVERARSNESLKDAVSAYDALRVLRSRLGQRYDSLKEDAWTHDQAMSHLADVLCVEHDVCDEFEGRILAAWVLDMPN